MSRGASSQIITIFLGQLGHGPRALGPQKKRALGPWGHFSELDGIGVGACVTLLCWVFFFILGHLKLTSVAFLCT